MSRSTVARSRAEKAGKPTAAAPAVTQEIVPGKYNDHDWNVMLDCDDGDDFVADVVDEICGSAIDVIYQNYIQQQLVPYTVVQAKDAILQIIEWQFLARDEGEKDVEVDTGWIEDEEAEPAETDCWAQGSVPRQQMTPRPRSSLKEVSEETSEEANVDGEPTQPEQEQVEGEPQSAQRAKTEEVEEEAGTQVAEEELADSIPVEESMQEEATQPETGAQKTAASGDAKTTKKKRGYKPHTGRLKEPSTESMTQSLEETEMELLKTEKPASPSKSPDVGLLQMPASCHSIVKLQAGRPPGNREVVFDDHGNVTAVTKLDPDRLPSHKVKTIFRVIDPTEEAAQAHLEAMRTGRYVKKRVPKPPDSPRSSATRTTVAKSTSRTTGSQRTGASHHAQTYGRTAGEGIGPLPPPLLECMEVSPGVVVKEGERVKHGPRQHPRRHELHQQGLRPITIKANIPAISVAQLLEQQAPVVRPLAETPPIPPITHQTSVTSQ